MNMITRHPKISIITPSYNRGQTLRQTIESVLGQGYPNLEYIIIDGGSTDNSLEIIKEYSQNIAYWVSEPDNGVYDAIRKGASHCTGDIMTWLGADDMLHPGSLAVVGEIFGQFTEVQWLQGANSWFDSLGRTINVAKSRYFSRFDLLSYSYKWIQQESTFWRKSLYEKVGGVNPELRLAGDFELWVKFSRHTKMYNVDALIGGFRLSTEGQLSQNMSCYEKEVDEIIKKEWQLYPDDYKVVDKIFWKRRIAYFLRWPYLSNTVAGDDEIKKQCITFDRLGQCFTIKH